MDETTPTPLAPESTRDAILSFCKQRFAKALMDAAFASGIRLPDLLAVLSASAERAFDELAGLRSREEYVKLRGITASRISLVHPEDMDLTVALINLAHALSDACEGRLSRLHLLFMTLLEQATSVVDQLPVGPDAACAALREFCDSGEVPPEMRLQIPERIEKELAFSLGNLYQDLTEKLSAAGLTPKSLVRSANESNPSQYGGGGLGSVRQHVESQANPPSAPVTPLGRLQSSLLRRRGGQTGGSGSGPGVGNTTDPALLQAILDQVMQWLSERQSEAAQQPYGAQSDKVNLGEVAGLLPNQSNAALEALNLSFDAVLLNPNLCSAIKPSLGRLRLPVCKAALLDEQFLSNPQHPARCLLDVCLRLATTLGPDTPPSHPVCLAIEEAACRVQKQFVRDPHIFAEVLLPLDVMDQTRNATATERAERLVSLGEREARREQARSRAARAVRALCASNPPEPVRIFLERLWVRVLAYIHQQQGERSQAWVQALSTANNLIESVQPKTDAESRRQLINSLSGLLAELRTGMESIGTPEILRERAFQSFVALHSAALHGRQADDAARKDVLPPPMPPRVDLIPEIPGLHIVRLAPDGEPERDLPEWIAQLKLGDWLQLTLPEARPQRLQVGWVGGMPRMLLLAQPDTDMVVLAPLRWLSACLADKTVMPLPMDALFEQAADAANNLYAGYA